RFAGAIAGQAGTGLAILSSRDEAAVAALEAFGDGALNHLNLDCNSGDLVHRPPLFQTDSTALSRLRKYVFSSSIPSEHEFDSSLEFASATDEARECVEIARSIVSAAEAGTVFDSMAILLRNPEGYQPLVEDALRRAGVPAYFSEGSRRPNPSGRAFLA